MTMENVLVEVCRPMTAEEVLRRQEQQQLWRQKEQNAIDHSNKVAMWVGIGAACFFGLICIRVFLYLLGRWRTRQSNT